MLHAHVVLCVQIVAVLGSTLGHSVRRLAKSLSAVSGSLSAVSGPPALGFVGRHGSARGRFGYSDLKEAALSGAADLWALNVGGLLLERYEPLVRASRVSWKRRLVAVDVLRSDLCVCEQAQLGAVEVSEGADRVCLREHGVGSRLELQCHAVCLSAWGGERASNCKVVNRSMTCMVPPQSGHFGRACVGSA